MKISADGKDKYDGRSDNRLHELTFQLKPVSQCFTKLRGRSYFMNVFRKGIKLGYLVAGNKYAGTGK